MVRQCAPNADICLAVKANAYGHGYELLTALAYDFGIRWFGVATVQEGINLRKLLPGKNINIILYGIPQAFEYPAILDHQLEIFIASEQQRQLAMTAASGSGKILHTHLKIDTGMGRIGCQPDEALALAGNLASSPGIALRGVCTHLPLSDSENTDYTSNQITRFADLVAAMRGQGINPGIVHCANSAGLSRFPESHFDMVRPGIMAYGYNPGVLHGPGSQVRPVMALQSTISFVKSIPQGTPVSYGHRWISMRDTRLATIPVGYADGLLRLASGALQFAVGQAPNTRLCPQVGTICMDQCLVDLGPDARETAGTAVTIFGHGNAATTAMTIAQAASTIPYEITCGIAERVPRILQ